jgi:zinc D-Ala-D-Ala carboxypeptidase
MSDIWRWPHFSQAEMACKCGCGKCEMVPEFMDELEALRERFGKPLLVSSGYRCPDHNERESPATGRTGPHTTGKACDFLISGPYALLLLVAATQLKFTGFGVKQHGPHNKRFLHLDTIHEGPRPALWSY